MFSCVLARFKLERVLEKKARRMRYQPYNWLQKRSASHARENANEFQKLNINDLETGVGQTKSICVSEHKRQT